jgi:hypothetical protein
MCGSNFFGKKCICGWEAPQIQNDRQGETGRSIYCKWKEGHKYCSSKASIGDNIDNMYCSFHYECYQDPSFQRDKQRVLSFWEQRKKYFKLSSQSDDNYAKGLIVLGENSLAWELAPDKIKLLSAKIKESGWKPKRNII